MAIDVATFKATYPEFIDAPDNLVQAKLTEAISMVPPAIWGPVGSQQDLVQQGTFLYCAKFLAESPYARDMRLVRDDYTTAYDTRLNQLKHIVTSGFRVT